MTTSPLVSVIIVSYNTSDLTKKCLKHVFASQGFRARELEVIVVDNNSQDQTVEMLSENFPQVIVIRNQVNTGFGAGNNQGIKKATGKYVLLLNTDAFLEKDTLKLLVETLEKHPDLSSVGPQYHFADGSLQMSAGYFPTPMRLIAWMWWLDKIPGIKKLFREPYHIFDLTWYQTKQHPDWLMGACTLFRREELTAIGGFDEGVFMYTEEVELYLRLRKSTGKKVLFLPAAKITHLGSASTKKAGSSRLGQELHGMRYLYARQYPSLVWFLRFVVYTGVVMRLVVFRFLPNRKDDLLEYKRVFKQII